MDLLLYVPRIPRLCGNIVNISAFSTLVLKFRVSVAESNDGDLYYSTYGTASWLHGVYESPLNTAGRGHKKNGVI